MPGSYFSREPESKEHKRLYLSLFAPLPIVPSLCCKASILPEDEKPKAHSVLLYLKAVKSGYRDAGSESGRAEGLICSEGHTLDLVSPVKEDFSVHRHLVL